MVNLLEALFAPDPPRTLDGLEPFLAPGDLARPNDAYFDHAVWAVERAADHGMLVLLMPAYLGYVDPHFPGYDNRAEGWYDELLAAGVEACRGYGAYVGRRFAHCDNVLWVMGGDRNPAAALEHVRALALGLRETHPSGLFTAHSHPDYRTLDQYPGDDWLGVNQTYTYRIVHRVLHDEYAATAARTSCSSRPTRASTTPASCRSAARPGGASPAGRSVTSSATTPCGSSARAGRRPSTRPAHASWPTCRACSRACPGGSSCPISTGAWSWPGWASATASTGPPPR